MKIEELLMDARRRLEPYVLRINPATFSKHNHGMKRYFSHSLMEAIWSERRRYITAIKELLDIRKNLRRKNMTQAQASVSGKVTHAQPLRVIDFGTMIPLLPLALRELGFSVTVVEDYESYGGALDGIRAFLESAGIRTLSFSILSEKFPVNELFDIALLLAVIEHIPHSPRNILRNISRVLKNNGYLIIDTPSVASLRKRLRFLLHGEQPLPAYQDFFESEPPFMGHHREYTVDDLKYALLKSNFRICKILQYNLKPPYFTSDFRISGLLLGVAQTIFKNLSDYITAVSIKENETSDSTAPAF